MRIFLVATLMAAFTLPAYSQMGGGGGGKGGGGRSTGSQKPAEDSEKKKRDEKEFNEAIKRIPVPDKKHDPWGNVRSTGK
jgi:hypothetical protein